MSIRNSLAVRLGLLSFVMVPLAHASPPASSSTVASSSVPVTAQVPSAITPSAGPPGSPPALAVMLVMDLDHDGALSANEISRAHESLTDLDKNHDGDVGVEELNEEVARTFPAPPTPPFGMGERHGPGPRGPRRPGPGPSWNGPQNIHHRSEAEAPLKHFAMFDKNKDEKITADELPSTIAWLVNDFDINHNGEMDWSEISDVESALFLGTNGPELRKQLNSAESLTSETIDLLKQKSRDFAHQAQQNKNQVAAQHRSSQIGYGVNVCVMFLSVIAFGHLLASHPPRLRGWREINPDPDAMSAVGYSVMFTSALAGLDLVWTLTSSQNSYFRELNPMGSLMLVGASLPLFRLTTIALSSSLFIALRKYRGAQVGSWWMCLVYVLVTWRWFLTKSILSD